jgi:hypothetical protein
MLILSVWFIMNGSSHMKPLVWSGSGAPPLAVWLRSLPQPAEQLSSLASEVIPMKFSYLAKTIMCFFSKADTLGQSPPKCHKLLFLFIIPGMNVGWRKKISLSESKLCAEMSDHFWQPGKALRTGHGDQ